MADLVALVVYVPIGAVGLVAGRFWLVGRIRRRRGLA